MRACLRCNISKSSSRPFVLVVLNKCILIHTFATYIFLCYASPGLLRLTWTTVTVTCFSFLYSLLFSTFLSIPPAIISASLLFPALCVLDVETRWAWKLVQRARQIVANACAKYMCARLSGYTERSLYYSFQFILPNIWSVFTNPFLSKQTKQIIGSLFLVRSKYQFTQWDYYL